MAKGKPSDCLLKINRESSYLLIVSYWCFNKLPPVPVPVLLACNGYISVVIDSMRVKTIIKTRQDRKMVLVETYKFHKFIVL